MTKVEGEPIEKLLDEFRRRVLSYQAVNAGGVNLNLLAEVEAKYRTAEVRLLALYQHQREEIERLKALIIQKDEAYNRLLRDGGWA